MKLYTDGGVIRKNPSPFGGTFAWILVDDDNDVVLDSGHGTVFPDRMKSLFVTNNQTELLAVIKGLGALHDHETANICSDSDVTLGRVFRGSPFNNIPLWMQERLKAEKKRLFLFRDFTYTLMDGHPTKEQLASGVGKRGHPTSRFNVWCDQKCQELAKEYSETLT